MKARLTSGFSETFLKAKGLVGKLGETFISCAQSYLSVGLVLPRRLGGQDSVGFDSGMFLDATHACSAPSHTSSLLRGIWRWVLQEAWSRAEPLPFSHGEVGSPLMF